MTFTPGDRKVLLCLIVLVAAYLIYASLHRPIASADTTHNTYSTNSSVSTPIGNRHEGVQTLGTSTPQEAKSHQVRPDSIAPIRTPRYPGPPKREMYPRVNKLRPGQTIDLNSADTIQLQMVPSIGPTFARRIYKWRQQLGGYYVVEQLQEVYGMDRERFQTIASFFVITSPVRPIAITQDSIPYHPYLQWRHRKELMRQLRRGDTISWKSLMDSGVFSTDDSLRLSPYLQL